MNHFLATLVTGLSQPLADALIVLFGIVAAKLVAFLSAHTKSVQVQAALVRLASVSDTVVREVAQTTVDELKAASSSGTLTTTEARTAAGTAFTKAKENLGGDKGMADIKKILGVDDVGALLTTHLEAAVHKLPEPVAEKVPT